MKKRSFDLAWGAWAGILAVMTAVGAAFAGSQILLMYPRTVGLLMFKYPSLPLSSTKDALRMDQKIPMVFWSSEGVLVGSISDLQAPVQSNKVLLRSQLNLNSKEAFEVLRGWVRENMSQPVRYIAIGQSSRSRELNFLKISELTTLFEDINRTEFSGTHVHPAVIPVELVNPL